MQLRIDVVTRFPLAERTEWKRTVVRELAAAGHRVRVVFGSRSVVAHLREAIRRLKLHRGSREVRLRDGGGGSATEVRSSQPRLTTFCRRHGVPVLRLDSVNSPAGLDRIRVDPPDLIVLCGAEIVGKTLLTIPRLGTINAHYGPLPRFRGMSAQEWSLFHGVRPAVTIHMVERRVDLGDLLLRRELELRGVHGWTALRSCCQALAATMILETVGQIAAGTAGRTPQKPDEGRQYYAIHPRLLNVAATRLSELASSG